MPRWGGALLAIVLAATGCTLLPVIGEAPGDCGFPQGAALAYAGRSTTALLGVNEAPGDPLSVEPADIYITIDAFDQGELRGRLVCAIYVTQGNFTEITVHPADDPFVPPDPRSRRLSPG